MTAVTRIDDATHSAIRTALHGPKTPLASLATSLAELRKDPSWSDREIEQVHRKAFWRLMRSGVVSRAQLERA